MALEIVDGPGDPEPEDKKGGFELPEPIYQTKDGRIVRESDPEILTLYRSRGRQIPGDLAVELGFVDQPKAEKKSPTKKSKRG